MHRARTFFFMCGGLLMLVAAYQVGVTTAGAAGRTTSVGAVATPEIAALQGVAATGFEIPLPTYGDGTVALESECTWTVSEAYQYVASHWCYTANGIYGEPPAISDPGFFAGRKGRIINVGAAGGPNGVANYMIVAVRSATQPTNATRSSWAEVKSRYR